MSQTVVVIGPNLPASLAKLGEFHVHAEGCAHLKRSPLKNYVREGDVMTVSTLVELCDAVYPPEDFDCASGEYRHEFHVSPCVTLPEGVC